jgi:hypothetical protein
MWNDRTPAGNSSLAQWRIQCLIEHKVFKITLVLNLNVVLLNPPLRQAASRYAQGGKSKRH